MTDDQRVQVVAEALTWQRTPYHEAAMLKGQGADCALFPLAVYRDTVGIKQAPIPKYGMQWHLHRGEEIFLETVRACGAVEIAGPPLPGDFVLWRMGRKFSHGAIVISWPQIIHATVMRGVTLEDAQQEESLRRREMKTFTI